MVPLRNAGNGVAGAIRNLDPKVTAERKLDMICYNVNYMDDGNFPDGKAMLAFLRENNFKLSDYCRYCSTPDEVMAALDEIESRRDSLDFLIDGAVVKVDNTAMREELGYTKKFPRWARAANSEPKEATRTGGDVK